MNYDELLTLTKKELNNQNPEVKDTIKLTEQLYLDENIETIMDVLENNCEQYLSFSHS